MLSPIPFCPSFEPWAKLTAVQVKTSSPRIHQAGGLSVSGERYSSGCRITAFITSNNSAEAKKPTRGENRSAFPTLVACPQSTPEVPSWPCSKALAMPTPMIDPINVCELDAGRPRYHVPRFQIIAAISSANTIANPAELPTCKISSTGRSESMPNATGQLADATPRKWKEPDQRTAICAGSECV